MLIALIALFSTAFIFIIGHAYWVLLNIQMQNIETRAQLLIINENIINEINTINVLLEYFKTKKLPLPAPIKPISMPSRSKPYDIDTEYMIAQAKSEFKKEQYK